MSVIDDLLRRGEQFGAAADRLGAAAEVLSVWALANRARADGELEEQVAYYLDIARIARPHIPSPSDARWRPERDLIASLGRAYTICASDEEHVTFLPRMEAAVAALLEITEVLADAPDADDGWLHLLDDEDAYSAHELFEHVVRAHHARWTRLSDDARRRFARIEQSLFRRVLTRGSR